MNEPWLLVSSWLEFCFCQGSRGRHQLPSRPDVATNKLSLGLLLRPLAFFFSHQKRKTTGLGSDDDRDRIDIPAYYEHSRRTRSYAARSDARIICLVHHQQRKKKMLASSFSDPTPPWSLSTHQKAENTTSNHVPSSIDAAFWHVAACARTHEWICIDQDSISPVPVDRPPWPDV